MHKPLNLAMDFELFVRLVQYTQQLPPGADPELQELRELLWKKLDKMVEHDLYSKSKTAPTEEEREEARRKYLDKRGIPESFRW